MNNTPSNKGVNDTNKRKISPKVEEKRGANKERFLSQLEEMPIIQAAAARTGINRSTYYRWKEKDRDFLEKVELHKKKGEEFINDMMESILIKKAKEGNMTAIIFWLKNHHEKYLDIKRLEHYHEFEENPLTDERKAAIANAVMAWSNTCSKCGKDISEEENELDSDYEPESIIENEDKKIEPIKAEPLTVKRDTPAPINSKLARRLVFKPKTKKLE